jgi:hypothetical protein
MAGFTSPYRYHNFIGNHANKAAAKTFFETTLGWGTMGASVGLGVSYWDDTAVLIKVWNGSDFVALTAATPALSAVLAVGADANSVVITNLGAPNNAGDAATKGYVDSVATGLMWKPPVLVINMVSNADQSGADPTGMVKGDCYVVNNWLTTDWDDGDIVEYSGTAWVRIQAATTGEPADGTRVIVKATGAAGSFVGQANKVSTYNATTDAWAHAAPADGWAALVIGNGGIWSDTGWTYTGSAWVQFTGAGQINAGSGLTKDGNTLNVGKGDGIAVGNDTVGIDLTSSNPGLELTGTSPNKTLQVMADGAHGIVRGASGVEIELAATAAKGGLVVDSDGVRSMQFNAGNPNSVVTGVLGEFCLDTTSKVLYVCTTAGSANWNVV